MAHEIYAHSAYFQPVAPSVNDRCGGAKLLNQMLNATKTENLGNLCCKMG